MTRIPFPALALGAAGLLPFAYGLLLIFSSDGAWPTFGLFPSSPEGGLIILERFGAAILGFMGGCLWGFSSAPSRVPTLALLTAASVPALIAALAIRPSPALSCVWLAFGFVVVQAIDVVFHGRGITPDYWLNLRLPLTALVMAALLAGALHG